jgi:hypothetical protein
MSEPQYCPHCGNRHAYVELYESFGGDVCDPVWRFGKAGNDHEDRARERLDRKRRGK